MARRLLKRLVLLAGGLFVGLVVAEIIAIAVGGPDPFHVNVRQPGQDCYRYLPNSPLRWVLDPDHPAHNSAGLRDEEFDPVPPTGRWRIAVIGDSIPFGIGVDTEQSYPEVLEDLLRDEGLDVEVINASVPAYNAQQIAAFLQDPVLSWQPHLVLVSVASNDLDSTPVIIRDGDTIRWEYYEDRHDPQALGPRDGAMGRLSLMMWRHSHLYRMLFNANMRRRFGATGASGIDVARQRNLDALVGMFDDCHRTGTDALAVLVPLLVDPPDPKWSGHLDEMAQALAGADRPFVDLRSQLLDHDFTPSRAKVAPDDPWHLSVEGNQRVAGLLAAELHTRGLVPP